MQEMQAESMAADVAHKNSLSEKARAEVQAMRDKEFAAQEADRRRRDPGLRTEYAATGAGVNFDDAYRLSGHMRGDMEQPAPGDIDDATGVGRDAQPYRMAKPNVGEGQERLFRSLLAAVHGTDFATKPTDALELAKAGGVHQENLVTQAVQDAIARGDYHGASAMSQGAKPGTAIKLHENIGNTGATFAPATGDVASSPTADPDNTLLARTLAEAAAAEEQKRAAAVASRAAAGASTAHAALYNAQAKNEGNKPATPPVPFKDVTTLRKEFNDQPEVKAYRDVIPIIESARTTPDSRAGDIQIAYAVGKILDPASVVREGELKLVGQAATMPEKIQGELRTLVMGKGRMTPATRAQLVAMLDSAVDQREKAYLAAESTYRRIAEQNRIPVDQVIIDAPRRKQPGAQQLAAKPAPVTNANGWRLMKDAAGNQAYVSPDGKSFEELR